MLASVPPFLFMSLVKRGGPFGTAPDMRLQQHSFTLLVHILDLRLYYYGIRRMAWADINTFAMVALVPNRGAASNTPYRTPRGFRPKGGSDSHRHMRFSCNDSGFLDAKLKSLVLLPPGCGR